MFSFNVACQALILTIAMHLNFQASDLVFRTSSFDVYFLKSPNTSSGEHSRMIPERHCDSPENPAVSIPPTPLHFLNTLQEQVIQKAEEYFRKKRLQAMICQRLGQNLTPQQLNDMHHAARCLLLAQPDHDDDPEIVSLCQNQGNRQ